MVANLNLGMFQRPAEIYVGILAATILFLATNAGLIGVSRLVYSMGIHRQLPDQLRQLHPKYRTPWIGILVFGVVAIIITLPGQAAFLGNLYAFGAMLSFTIAHLALIRLRISQARRGAALPAAREHEHPRPRHPDVRGHRRARDVRGVRRHRRRCTWTSRPPASAGCRSASSSTCSTGAGRGWI